MFALTKYTLSISCEYIFFWNPTRYVSEQYSHSVEYMYSQEPGNNGIDHAQKYTLL